MKEQIKELNETITTCVAQLDIVDDLYDSIYDRQKTKELLYFKIEECSRKINKLINNELITIAHNEM